MFKRLVDLQEGDCFYFTHGNPASSDVYQYFVDHIRRLGYTLTQTKQFVPTLQEDVENFNADAVVKIVNLFAAEEK